VPRCAAWSATALRHYTTTPVRSALRTLKKGQRNPRKDDAQLLCARTGRRHDVKPGGAVTSVAIGPVRPPRPLHHHARRCGTCGDRTPPRQPLCLVRPHVSGTLKSPRGQPSNEQPQRHPPRSRFWRRTGYAVTPRQKRDSPGQPSTPWHCTPCLYT
jgi:hypothetical protein